LLESLGADLRKIRTINRTVVVNTIRNEGPISKAKIVRLTGISAPTVNRVVDELLREDLICKVSNQHERGGGRPGELFEFNGKCHFVIGIDVALPNMRGMVADLTGEIITELTEPVVRGNGIENYQRLLSLISRLLDETVVDPSKIYGIGLGVGGVVDSTKGVILQSEITGWNNFPLSKRLQQETGFIPYIDNDINLVIIGEHGFGVGQNLTNIACVTLGTRVLCGLIINGELYHGSTFNDGRIDQFISHQAYDSPCVLDEAEGRGPFERLVSSPNILKMAKIALIDDPILQEKIQDPKQVYQAAGAGEAWALKVIESIVPPLAIAFANISALLDLEMIIISGRLAEESSVILPMINQYLSQKTTRTPYLKSSTLGSRATVLGAVMLGYKGILNNW